ALSDADYVTHIAYNAKGQRILTAYGNGMITRHVYDAQMFRLVRLRTDHVNQSEFFRWLAEPVAVGGTASFTLQSARSPTQHFAYAYDLVGNITAGDEHTPKCGITGTTEGQARLPRKFEYDPIYRLTMATGRACKDIGVPRGLDDDQRCGFHAGGSAS